MIGQIRTILGLAFPIVKQYRNWRWKKKNITIDITEIKRMIREYFENSYSKKLENLEEMDKFLDTHDLQKWNQEDINNLNRLLTSNETEAVIKKKISQQWIL
jgi:hypothetical protein